MSYESAIHVKLTADITLMALLTGGMYYSENMKQIGITRTSVPSAFDSSGFIKPCGVVIGRNVIPIQPIKTPASGYRIVQQSIEVYLYNDADAGYSTLKTAKDRVVTLLDMKTVTNSFAIQLEGEVIFREIPLNNACAIRIDFNLTGKR